MSLRPPQHETNAVERWEHPQLWKASVKNNSQESNTWKSSSFGNTKSARDHLSNYANMKDVYNILYVCIYIYQIYHISIQMYIHILHISIHITYTFLLYTDTSWIKVKLKSVRSPSDSWMQHRSESTTLCRDFATQRIHIRKGRGVLPTTNTAFIPFPLSQKKLSTFNIF